MKPFDPVESFANATREFGEHGGVNMSIEPSTTFTVMQPGTMPKMFEGKVGPDVGGCYLYGRHFNPTVYTLARELAAIEGTEGGYCTASGMSAISAVAMQCCDAGDHIVAGDTLYGGTFALLNDFLPAKTGVRTSFVSVTDHAAIEAAFTAKTKLLYVEAVSNPTLTVADIPALAAIAHKHGTRLAVDNTFAPMILSPAKLGDDIVIHSLTKFVNGASDIIAGAICADQAFIDQLVDLHTGAIMLLGPTMDPRTAFEISMRLPHLGIRMTEHSRRAQTFSERLAALNLAVTYPGLPVHPQHELLKTQANPGYGFGGLLCLDLETTEKAYQFMEVLQNTHQFGYMAVSLGYFDTLVSCPGSSTSSELSADDQARAGISPGLIRISLGYTGSLEQRWEQLLGALKTVGAV